MKPSELLVLPHTLTWHGQGEVNIQSDARSQITGEEQQHMAGLEVLLSQMMLSPQHLQQWQRSLATLADGLPVPEALPFEPWHDEDLLQLLSPEQKRVYRVFQQLLQDERKSQRYAEAFQGLCEAFPEQETLWHMYFAYAYRWGKVDTALLQDKLQQHSHWLFLRLLYARETLKEEDFDPERYREAMGQKLLLQEHLSPELILTDLLVYQFHLDTFMFFSLAGHLERAAFSFWQAHAACSVPEALYSLALFLLATCEKGPEDPRFVQFVKFLQRTAALKV